MSGRLASVCYKVSAQCLLRTERTAAVRTAVRTFGKILLLLLIQWTNDVVGCRYTSATLLVRTTGHCLLDITWNSWIPNFSFFLFERKAVAPAAPSEGLPPSLERVGKVEAFPNEYPGQVYAFNWCLNGDGVTPVHKSAFRITKPLDLKVAGLALPKKNPLAVRRFRWRYICYRVLSMCAIFV